jgi:hypothetical protein
MRTGLQIPNFTWPGGPGEIHGRLVEIAHSAEYAGIDNWRCTALHL